MYERPRRARVVFVVLMLAAATVVTLDFRERDQGPVARLQQVATAVFGPVQRAVSAVFRPLGEAVSGIAATGSLRAENRRLRDEVARLRAGERGYQDVLTENQQLRGALAMSRRCGCRTVAAKVVAGSGSNFQWSVTIDAGSERGIAKDMAVLNADGLVGRVVRASAGYANVLLVTDPSSGVAATLAGSKAPGLLRGRGERDLELELIHPDVKVRVGEPVLSQGYQQGVFPSGIPIGVVTASPPPGELARRLAVRPFADVHRLDVLAVVVAKPPPPGGPRRPPAASGAGR